MSTFISSLGITHLSNLYYFSNQKGFYVTEVGKIGDIF